MKHENISLSAYPIQNEEKRIFRQDPRIFCCFNINSTVGDNDDGYLNLEKVSKKVDRYVI